MRIITMFLFEAWTVLMSNEIDHLGDHSPSAVPCIFGHFQVQLAWMPSQQPAPTRLWPHQTWMLLSENYQPKLLSGHAHGVEMDFDNMMQKGRF